MKYIDLYKVACCMSSDLVLTVMAIKRYGDVDWEKTAMKKVFVSYNFPTSGDHDFSKECV